MNHFKSLCEEAFLLVVMKNAEPVVYACRDA